MAESDVILLSQDQMSGNYQVAYQFKQVGLYVIRFYLNGFQMP